jgi:hypothetical protein
VGYAAHLAGVWDGVQHGTLDLPAGVVDGGERLVGVHGRVDLQQQRPAHPAATNAKDAHPGQTGSKYHLLVDRRGIPLAVDLSAANTHDSLLLEAMVDAIPAVKGPRGRPGRPRRRGPPSSTATRATTTPAAGGRCADVASRPGSPGAASSQATSWTVIGAWWSGRWPGWSATGGCRSATSGAPISCLSSSTLPAR